MLEILWVEGANRSMLRLWMLVVVVWDAVGYGLVVLLQLWMARRLFVAAVRGG